MTAFSHLAERCCRVLFPDRTQHNGRYRFTVDWYGTSDAERAGDGGHKCAHVIELEDGNYCALPNNRILWADPALIPTPFQARPDYLTTTHTWNCEQGTKWAAEDTDRMFYAIQSLNGSQDGARGATGASGSRPKRSRRGSCRVPNRS